MNLLERSEAQVRRIEGGLKPEAVFHDIFWSVPFHKAEIEDPLGFELAHTSGTSAEAVSEPGKFSESGEFENLQASGSANVPRRADCRMRRSWMTAENRGRAGASARRGSLLLGHDATSIIGAMCVAEMDAWRQDAGATRGEARNDRRNRD